MRLLRLGASIWAASMMVLVGITVGADARQAPAQPRVSLAVPHEVTAGAAALATGKVTPAQGRIVLQVRRSGAWRALGGGRVRAGGAFRVSFTVPKGTSGALRLRATLMQGGKPLGLSPVRTLRIGRASIAEPPPGGPIVGPIAPAVAAPIAGSTTPPPGGGTTPPSEPSPPVEEPTSAPDAYWGAWIGSQLTGQAAPWDMTAVTKFEEHTEKPLSLLEFSSPWAECSGSTCTPTKFPTTPFNSIRAHGAIPFFSWGSESTPGSATEPEYQLADIISGKYDSYIHEFATKARDWGHPFFLRFDWEMDGSWFPWGEGTNGNQPGEFVAAWRHVHDIFTSVGATNATWVWCPFVNHPGLYASLYPGDTYVDWTCLDGYNWGTNPSNPHEWKSFDGLYHNGYAKLVETVAPSKPVVIGEVASSEDGGSKAAWIKEMFEVLATPRYSQVRGLIWFEAIANAMDWPIETSATAQAAFAAGVSESRFRSNEFGGIDADPIPPPEP